MTSTPPASQPANNAPADDADELLQLRGEAEMYHQQVWPWYLAIAFVAVLMRVIVAGQVKTASLFVFINLQSDARSYHEWGKTIAAGDWIGTTTFYQAPLYPYFVGLIYSIFGVNPLWVRAVQVALAAIACVMLAEAGRRWFNAKVGVIAGFMLAVYPPAVYFALINQKPGLALPLICLLLVLMAFADTRRFLAAYLGAGVALGLLALNRENTLIWLPVLLLWALLSPWPLSKREAPRPIRDKLKKQRAEQLDETGSDTFEKVIPQKRTQAQWGRRLGQMVLVVVGLAVVLLPVAMRNQHVGGEFHLTTSQFGTNFYIGNNAEANGLYKSLRWGQGDPKFERIDATQLAEEAQGRTLSPGEVSAYWTNRSLNYMKEQPTDWLELTGVKALLTINRAEVADADDYYSYADLSPVLFWLDRVFNMGVLFPLAVLGLLAAWHHLRVWWPAALLTLAYAAGVVMFYIMARYRFPLVPLLMLPAAAALVMTLFSFLSWNWLQKIGAIVIVAAAAYAANIPIETITAWRGTPVSLSTMRGTAQLNVAIQMLGDEHDRFVDDAAGHATRALDLNPNSSMARLVLAEVRAKQGRYDEAAALIEEADQRMPDDPAATARLARTLAAMAFYQATEPDEAKRNAARAADWATTAVQLTEARDAHALDALAAAAAQLGQFDKAVRFAGEAHAIASADDKSNLAAAIAGRLQLYESGKSFVRSTPDAEAKSAESNDAEGNDSEVDDAEGNDAEVD